MNDDNVIPFDASVAVDDQHVPLAKMNQLPADDVKLMNQLEDRLAGLARLIDGTGEMLSNWQTGEEEYSSEDLGVVSRTINSMEQALYMSVDPDDQHGFRPDDADEPV